MARPGILVQAFLALAVASSGFELRAEESLASRFNASPAEAGMTIYRVWFGSAITEEMIDRDLATMKAAGISGTVLLPVYPMALDDPEAGVKNLRLLSPEYLAMLRHAAKRSGELGMTLDVTIGTGWPHGGPWITPERAARMIRMRPAGGKVAPGEKVVGVFGDKQVEARQIRHDYWLTLSELASENFLRPLQQWCHGKGVKLRGEAYGQPPAMLGSYRYVDEPCGEHYEWRMLNASRWKSVASMKISASTARRA